MVSQNQVPQNPRGEIEVAIAKGDVRGLLVLSATLHGHFCPGLAMGVKAAASAVRELRVSSTGMEEVVAIVETNSCFSDGVQFVTGCSFGNNALIYRDFGKTAFTLARRSGEALRVSMKADRRFLEEREPEATALFQKVVVARAGTDDDQRRLSALWTEASFRLLEVSDEELLDLQPLTVEVPAFARIFASVVCSSCGESVMEPRARMRDGRPVCLPCSGHGYYQLGGDGMSVASGTA